MFQNKHNSLYKYERYIEKEVTGKLFNQIFRNASLVKLTNLTENHNGLKFDDDLNIDILSFNTNTTCSAGGIYFIEEHNMHKWIFYNIKVGFMYHVRKVTIPDDARVFIESDKFKTDKIIFGPKKLIDKNTYLKAIEYNNVFRYMPNNLKDRDMCMKAIRNDVTVALCYVPAELKDKDMCVESVKLCGTTLRYVPHYLQDKDMCMEAIRYNSTSLEFVADSLKDKELCTLAVECYEYTLKYIPDTIKDKEMCMKAIKQDSVVFKYVPLKIIDKEICMEVVRKNGALLSLIPTELRDIDVCKLAVEHCDYAIYYVPLKLRKAIYECN